MSDTAPNQITVPPVGSVRTETVLNLRYDKSQIDQPEFDIDYVYAATLPGDVVLGVTVREAFEEIEGLKTPVHRMEAMMSSGAELHAAGFPPDARPVCDENMAQAMSAYVVQDGMDIGKRIEDVTRNTAWQHLCCVEVLAQERERARPPRRRSVDGKTR